jgi:hypothetical protein
MHNILLNFPLLNVLLTVHPSYQHSDTNVMHFLINL